MFFILDNGTAVGVGSNVDGQIGNGGRSIYGQETPSKIQICKDKTNKVYTCAIF